ncbi:MAG: histidine kinase dimerization/phospho-acceptor domain-containing protein [Bdellovibrionota bacterium]|nr:MAG: histidine kinase dimerization/phospho-acceptor domain-containing protein [Bdellovibrionota bacterium]
MNSDLRYLRAFSRLFAAVSHRIRNPLNVISNELAFLEGQNPSEDVARARKRCREIQDLLKYLSFEEATDAVTECRLHEICSPITVRVHVPDAVIVGSAALLTRAFQELARCAEQLGAFISSAAVEPEHAVLWLEGRHHRFAATSKPSESLSELLVSYCGLDEPASAVFDLLWWAMGGTIDAVCGDGTVKVHLTIPLRTKCSS